MKSILIMEVGRISNTYGRGKAFEDLEISDFIIPFSIIASLDVFIITDTYNDKFRIMKIRRDVDNGVRDGVDIIEREVAYIEQMLTDRYSNNVEI